MSSATHEIDLYLNQLRRGLTSPTNCSLEPLCSALLRLDDQPFTLEQHFPLRPLLRRTLAKRTLIKAGRQIGKSTTIAAAVVIRAFAIPHFKIMIVTPIKSQVTNISNKYVKPFILTSPLRDRYVDPQCAKATLYKEFKNGSRIVFLYAQLDASRTRSYSNDMLLIDEVQDFDLDNIPVIRETLTASPWRLEVFTGTPLSLDNTIEQLWQESSACELVIKCDSCSFFNIASLDQHLERMIGPLREDISEKSPATICAQCGKPISPRRGKWVPRFPQKRGEFDGYHISQVIMPMHYADFSRWKELLDKRDGKGPTPRFRFVNEVLGESFDEAAALLSSADLLNAAVLGPNSFEEAIQLRLNYRHCALAIDWGGGGQEGLSLTTFALAGLQANGTIDILFGGRILNAPSPRDESRILMHYISTLRPTFVVHDYTNAGSVREAYLFEWGLSDRLVLPVYFVGSSTHFMFVPVQNTVKNRTFYKMDKTKAYQFVSAAIKELRIRFFRGEYDEGQKLLNDFITLREERTVTPSGRETYRIIKLKKSCDDFAACTAMACVSLWHATGSWPVLSVHD